MTEAIWVPAPILVEHLEGAPPDTLYHYTNQSGLLGIVRKRELWASSIHYLNDHQEFRYGVGLFDEYLRDARNRAEKERQRHFDAMLGRIHQQLHPQTPVDVASWSAADDDLGQWRAYSGSGTGYAIGMRGATIVQLATKQRFNFAACVYQPDEHSQWVKQIVETSLNEMVDDESRGIHYGRAVPGDNFLSRLLRFSPLIKHPKFSGEKEWRLTADSFRVIRMRVISKAGLASSPPRIAAMSSADSATACRHRTRMRSVKSP